MAGRGDGLSTQGRPGVKRMAARRKVLDGLASSLMRPTTEREEASSRTASWGVRHNNRHNVPSYEMARRVTI